MAAAMRGAAPTAWDGNWRDRVWSCLVQDWDVVVIGGGITGAGVFHEAARRGLRALLLEQRDFAWGTSSRSSKLVHGGLRYLRQGQIALTHRAVRERRRLLDEAPGLVEPVAFLCATRRGDPLGRLLFRLGLSIYDLMAGRLGHRRYAEREFRFLAPLLAPEGRDGGFGFEDAQTDDARLVLRVLREGVALGGTALNYAAVTSLLRTRQGVAGIALRDVVSGRTAEVRGRAVVNATGAWADGLRGELGSAPRVRPLRGSHLVFPAWRVPVAQALSLPHPWDRRSLFIVPWEGATLLGTTDLDHRAPLGEEPSISPEEAAYLMAAAESALPSLGLSLADVVASFAGVRPVIGTGKADPSRESRDHAIWEEDGLLTVTGGKLTTFRLIARDALWRLRRRLPEPPSKRDRPTPWVAADVSSLCLEPAHARRLLGRYGTDAAAFLSTARPDELTEIPGTKALWAELRWAARTEAVVHLEDLLLRRVRLGLLLSEGGLHLMERIRGLCLEELGWTDARWSEEVGAYERLWRACYGPPQEAAVHERRGGRGILGRAAG
jgi:glycerol-3-phosphate dehydrogenase